MMPRSHMGPHIHGREGWAVYCGLEPSPLRKVSACVIQQEPKLSYNKATPLSLDL